MGNAVFYSQADFIVYMQWKKNNFKVWDNKCFSKKKNKVCIQGDGNLLLDIKLFHSKCSSPYKSHCKTGTKVSPHIVICML